jgi:hypothetical protein
VTIATRPVRSKSCFTFTVESRVALAASLT